MKKIFTKIITAYIIIASLAIVLKVGDNMIAKADVLSSQNCGYNTGWIWNGTQCVNTCDQNHPWDPVNQRCSNGYGYYGNSYGYVPGNSNYMGSCDAYGSNFYWTGSVCAQIVPGQNYPYQGSNPYNGGYTYINDNYNYYNYPTYQIQSVPVNNTVYNLSNNYPYNNYNYCDNSCWHDPAPKVTTTYQVYTYTTISQPSYPNYFYLGSNSSQYYNDYLNCNYLDYRNLGYYDIYGYYHY
jgi:hypothetical protein